MLKSRGGRASATSKETGVEDTGQEEVRGGQQSHWKTLQGEESHRKILHRGVSYPAKEGL